MQNNLKEQLRIDMINLYKETTEVYYATRYLEMLYDTCNDAYNVAIKLVSSEDKLGFTKLYEVGRLDLSLEALLIKQYKDLFPADVIEKCQKRLTKYGYVLK